MSNRVVPEPSFVVLQGESEGLPDVWIVNHALAGFDGKPEFPWHLSIIVECAETLDNGLPTPAEGELLKQVGTSLDGGILKAGNALQLARITWNQTRQYVYRVRDPEMANAYLQAVIGQDSSLRPFQYEMVNDPAWALAQPHLSPLRQL